MSEVRFTVYGTPTPQGSMKGFVIKGRPVLTSDNKKLKPFRQEVSRTALDEVREQCGGEMPFGKHVPVEMELHSYFKRPPSIPKKRAEMVVKPDIDKLARSSIDALTGIVFFDDSQIVSLRTTKSYGVPERVELRIKQISSVVDVCKCK